MTQRVLTQSRILIFYLSLLFYPAPFRLSLIHDIQLSTSLIAPITTLFSIISIALLIILPFVYHRRYPLFSFSILFFLLNHTVESTFLSLELIFEHRNYLPSLFLFLPAAAALGTLIKKYQHGNRIVYVLLSAVTGFLVLSLVLGTFARNKVWQTEQSLWADAWAKAPQSAGPYINLGQYYRSVNNLQKSFELNFLSLDKYAATPWKSRVWAYNAMAHIMTLTENYRKTLELYDKALAASRDKPYGNYNAPILAEKAWILWRTKQKEQAVQIMAELVEARSENGGYLQQHGEMLIALNRVEEGAAVLQRVFAHSDMKTEEYRKTLLNFALIYARMGFMDKSSFYIHLADMLGVPVVPRSLCVIEISLLTDRQAEADQAMQAILSKITWPELITILYEQAPNIPSKAINYPLLRQYAADWIARQREASDPLPRRSEGGLAPQLRNKELRPDENNAI
jgi:tetratricopeptide (TPR) repeat protein